MKTKILLSFVSAIFSIAIFAGNVTKEQAQKVALNFYFEKYNRFEGQVSKDQLNIQSVYTETDGIQNFYYVFHISRGGFVMVSADDRLNPVLGYSFDHPFGLENQPPNVQWWLQNYVDQVKYSRENQMKQDSQTAELWDYYLDDNFKLSSTLKDSKAVEPLITSLWNQEMPYNYLCPVDPAGPGGHALTGCVATAYAQMLYYWRFPLHGSGYHCYTPASHPEYGEQCADFENTWYRWDEMNDSPQTLNIAIAELMYHVGVAVEMDYGPDASAAMGYPEQIEPPFNISTDYDSLRHDFYTNEEWVNIIVDQLNHGFPIGYIGFTSNMSIGHMWVCDGYQDSTHFNMNWGWGGASNGYYTLNNLQGFNTFQYIGINFYPDTINYTYPNYANGPDTLTSFEGSIEDGSGPTHNYLNNIQASWLIDPQTEFDSVTKIIIMVKRLDIFNDGDRLYIYDGEDNSAPLLAELCGNTLPADIESSGNKVFIEFITDGSNTASGFYLNYKTVRPVWCSGMTQLTQPAGTFDDGSADFYYANSSTCLWMIDPGISDPLTLHFNYFNTEENNDKLKIYDASTQEVLAEISGYYENPPEPVTSSSGKIMLAFQTNSSIQGQGWEAWYDINTGIPDNTQEFGFSIIPNPVTSEVKFSFSLPTGQQVSIWIFDVVGKESLKIPDEYLTEGRHTVAANLGNLKEGIYFCRVQIGNETITKKIIKVK